MTEQRGDRMGRRRVSGPMWSGLAGVAFGLMAFAAILIWRDSAKAFGDALGTAVSAFLGSVVAGWGITQALIAQETRKATEGQATAATLQVVAVNQQLELQRDRVEYAEREAKRARKEAEFHRDHADRTLRATIKQRLDAQMPNVTMRIISAPNPYRCTIRFEDRGHEASETFDMQADPMPQVSASVAVRIEMLLTGDVSARIDWDQYQCDGEFVEANRPTILTAHERTALVTWRATFSATGQYTSTLQIASSQPILTPWQPRFLVRDIGMNVGEYQCFSGFYGAVTRDGSRMMVAPGLSIWGLPVAEPLPRRYEYFERDEGKAELRESA